MTLEDAQIHVRNAGGCGAIIDDGTCICVLEEGHGPHGGEARGELGPPADVRTALLEIQARSRAITDQMRDGGILATETVAALAVIALDLGSLAQALLMLLDREHGGA